jgi:hypothetical protein
VCFKVVYLLRGGPGISVDRATGYGLDGPGIETRWGEIYRTSPDRPWGPPSVLYNGYRVFPGGTMRPGRALTPHPLLVLRSKNRVKAIPLLFLRAFVACKKGKTYHIFFAYSCCEISKLRYMFLLYSVRLECYECHHWTHEKIKHELHISLSTKIVVWT